MATEPGWADALGQELAGDSDQWQRTRARGGRPFRVCSDDVLAKAKRGAARGGPKRQIDRRLRQALGPVEDE
jgi:hypothetical protein